MPWSLARTDIRSPKGAAALENALAMIGIGRTQGLGIAIPPTRVRTAME